MKSMLTFLVVTLTTSFLYGQIYVKQDAIGTNDGSSWENAFTKLQFALDAAAPGDQVWIAAGNYTPSGPTPESSHFLVTTPVELYGGFIGNETALQQRNWATFFTIINGDISGNDVAGDFNNNRDDNAHHTLIINAGETNTVIDGLIFTGGTTRLDAGSYAPDENDIPYNRWSGGALYIYRSGATIRNCEFRDNNGSRGSCFYAFGDMLSTISLVVESSFFMNNNGYNGAASYTQGFRDYQNLYCRFTNNTGYQGGAVFLSNTNAYMKDCIFSRNLASYGGALQVFHENTTLNQNPVTTLSNCQFINNIASSRAGAINLTNSYKAFTCIVDSCNFKGNIGTEYGGGIAIEDQPDNLSDEQTCIVRITNNSFENNTAYYGGGIEAEPGDDSIRIELLDNQFTKNGNSEGIGGGVYISGNGPSRGICRMINNTFLNNTAFIAGGAFLENHNNINRWSYEIDQCLFGMNEASNSGGAIVLDGQVEANIERSKFDGNTSVSEGAAIHTNGDVIWNLDNSLFTNQSGKSTLFNTGTLNMVNVTISGQSKGVVAENGSVTTLQNSVLNTGINLLVRGNAEIITQGGNISNDNTTTSFLTGSGDYQDLNQTDPILGPDMCPIAGSPCVDMGNPGGVSENATDLVGNPRIQGNSIDAGCFETILVAVQNTLQHSMNLEIFPNPANDELNVNLNDAFIGKTVLTFFNNNGQVVLETRLDKMQEEQTFPITIRNLLPGNYLLQVKSGFHAYSNTLIIQR